MMTTNKFSKQERIVSRNLMERLFGGASRSAVAYPLRVVFMTVDDADACMPPVQVLVSVSKRHFKHAVDRNRVKRQIREAYRLNKHILSDAVLTDGTGSAKFIAVAFIWLSDALKPSAEVGAAVRKLLMRIADNIYNSKNVEKSE